MRSYQKVKPARSELYRRLVAALPCALCGIEGFSQCAHADAGKGMGIKTDDRLCFPLCGNRVGKIGCHSAVGSNAHFSKQDRREFEEREGESTARAIYASGRWPKSVPVPWFIAMGIDELCFT